MNSELNRLNKKIEELRSEHNYYNSFVIQNEELKWKCVKCNGNKILAQYHRYNKGVCYLCDGNGLLAYNPKELASAQQYFYMLEKSLQAAIQYYEDARLEYESYIDEDDY